MFPQEFILFTATYFLAAFFLIVPPYELRSAGFCIEYIFANYLGNEIRDFVAYQIRRTNANLLLHCSIPIGYYLCGVLCTDYFYKSLTPTAVYVWAVYIFLSLSCLTCGIALFVYRSIRNYSYHPLAIALKNQAIGANHQPLSQSASISVGGNSSPNNETGHDDSSSSSSRRNTRQNPLWTTVARSINTEMTAEGDKFTSGPHNCRIYVTSNWLIQTAIYSTHIVHKSDIHLVLASKQELEFTTSSRFSEEYITIEVHSINQTVKPFNIRLNSREYNDLTERLSAPVINARNIVLSQSISERFVTAFKSCVLQNEKFFSYSSSGAPCGTVVDLCIGCNVGLSDVKLMKSCPVQDCGNCFCRPMWCAVCLSKWFAARQDHQSPHLWLQGTAPCPTCRAKFCMLDVCLIHNPLPSADIN